MAYTVLKLDIEGLHGWAVMVITAIMAGYNQAVMGLRAMMAFTRGSSDFSFIFRDNYRWVVTIVTAMMVEAEIHRRDHRQVIIVIMVVIFIIVIMFLDCFL